MNQIASITSKCSSCKEDKLNSMFPKNKSRVSGLSSYCAHCMKERYSKSKYKKGDFRVNGDSKKCSKCLQLKGLSNYRKDNTKPDGLYSSCNDCYRGMVGSVRKIEKNNPKSFTVRYRNCILQRDNNICILCGSINNLHIHHILPRKAGGIDSSHNLITLCSVCHNNKAHSKRFDYYSELFKSYTTKYEDIDYTEQRDIMFKDIIIKNRNIRNLKHYHNKKTHI